MVVLVAGFQKKKVEQNELMIGGTSTIPFEQINVFGNATRLKVAQQVFEAYLQALEHTRCEITRMDPSSWRVGV